MSNLNTVVCQGCGASAKIDPVETGGNVGRTQAASGYTPIIHIDTSFGWWCPVCAEKAVPHIIALLDLLGENEKNPRTRTYWNCLPNIVASRKAPVVPGRGKTSVFTGELLQRIEQPLIRKADEVTHHLDGGTSLTWRDRPQSPRLVRITISPKGQDALIVFRNGKPNRAEILEDVGLIVGTLQEYLAILDNPAQEETR